MFLKLGRKKKPKKEKYDTLSCNTGVFFNALSGPDIVLFFFQKVKNKNLSGLEFSYRVLTIDAKANIKFGHIFPCIL